MQPPTPAGREQDDAARLDQLRTDFPDFDIAREVTPGRIRYVSRRRRPGVQPHTVVTADLDELRAALLPRQDGPVPGSSGGYRGVSDAGVRIGPNFCS
jgi:hypothetical protein